MFYEKKEEFRGQIIDRVFNYQFINVRLENLEEHFDSYCVLIDKLKTSFKIDLLDADTGVDKVLAHLTFKKFPQNVKNVLMQICDNHYPTFNELIVKLPVAVERISKSKGADIDIVSTMD